MKAVIVSVNGVRWACCGHCGHKLGKVEITNPNENTKAALDPSQKVKMEIKCHSCKTINEIEV